MSKTGARGVRPFIVQGGYSLFARGGLFIARGGYSLLEGVIHCLLEGGQVSHVPVRWGWCRRRRTIQG